MSSKPIEIYQGSDRTIVVKSNKDVTTSTEIEVRIDTCPQITKTLTAGEITGVTATGFNVVILAEDTRSITPQNYEIQSRETSAGGIVTHGIFAPDMVSIKESIFV